MCYRNYSRYCVCSFKCRVSGGSETVNVEGKIEINVEINLSVGANMLLL